MPVAMSLGGSKSLEELHAAAAFSRAAHPMEAPEDGESSMAALLQAVRRQADPPAAVTTALVALLHVPSRPRLAFPTGRPSRKHAVAEAAEAGGAAVGAEEAAGGDSAGVPVGSKRKAPAEESEGEGEEQEKLPDADNYLEGFPSVASLMDQFRRAAWRGERVFATKGSPECMLCGLRTARPHSSWQFTSRAVAGANLPACLPPVPTCRARGQPKTPLAVVHEYAARLNLQVVIEETGTARPDGTSGPPFTGVLCAGDRGGMLRRQHGRPLLPSCPADYTPAVAAAGPIQPASNPLPCSLCPPDQQGWRAVPGQRQRAEPREAGRKAGGWRRQGHLLACGCGYCSCVLPFVPCDRLVRD